jgi:hypothetical protein
MSITEHSSSLSVLRWVLTSTCNVLTALSIHLQHGHHGGKHTRNSRQSRCISSLHCTPGRASGSGAPASCMQPPHHGQGRKSHSMKLWGGSSGSYALLSMHDPALLHQRMHWCTTLSRTHALALSSGQYLLLSIHMPLLQIGGIATLEATHSPPPSPLPTKAYTLACPPAALHGLQPPTRSSAAS